MFFLHFLNYTIFAQFQSGKARGWAKHPSDSYFSQVNLSHAHMHSACWRLHSQCKFFYVSSVWLLFPFNYHCFWEVVTFYARCQLQLNISLFTFLQNDSGPWSNNAHHSPWRFPPIVFILFQIFHTILVVEHCEVILYTFILMYFTKYSFKS